MNNRYKIYKNRRFVGFCDTLEEGKSLISQTGSIIRIKNNGKRIITSESKADETIEYCCYIIKKIKNWR